MTPDEFLNQDFKSMKFSLDTGRLELSKIQLLIESKWHTIAMLKNQHRIMQLLKSGTIDEDKLTDDFNYQLDKLHENINKELMETMSYISSGSSQ